MEIVDPDAIHASRERCGRRSARALATSCCAAHRSDGASGDDLIAAAKGIRRLRTRRARSARRRPIRRRRGACQGAVRCGRQHDRPPGRARRPGVARRGREREAALDAFYDRFNDDALVLDKWFALQAAAQRPDTVDQVLKLAQPSRLHHHQPQPPARAGRDVRRQPLGVPFAPRARLPLPRRHDHRRRQDQSAGRRAAGAAARPLAALRAEAGGADARRRSSGSSPRRDYRRTCSSRRRRACA